MRRLTGDEGRAAAGLEIYEAGQVLQVGGGYQVQSQSRPPLRHATTLYDCGCEDYQYRHPEQGCKHMRALALAAGVEPDTGEIRKREYVPVPEDLFDDRSEPDPEAKAERRRQAEQDRRDIWGEEP